MRSRAIVLAVAAISCGTAASETNGRARSVSAQHAAFAQYETFSFGSADQPAKGYEVSPHSLEVQKRLVEIVEATFRERGYVKTGGRADFVVKLASGTGEPKTMPPEQRGGTVPATGFIGIDVYDGASGTQVWQGSAFAEIEMERIDDALLARGVNHMLTTFPGKDAAGSSKD